MGVMGVEKCESSSWVEGVLNPESESLSKLLDDDSLRYSSTSSQSIVEERKTSLITFLGWMEPSMMETSVGWVLLEYTTEGVARCC